MSVKLLDFQAAYSGFCGMVLLSPLEKISGGFGFLTDEQGKRIQSAGQVSPGDRISIQVRDGKILARVEKGWKI